MNFFTKAKVRLLGITLGMCVASTALMAAEKASPLEIRVVNFKTCVELSKAGKQEQAAFEALKKQMEAVLEEKEKTINDMASKFNDADYLDSLPPEAEVELKRKFRALSQEITQQQNQYMQTLNQTNFKVVQKLTDMVAKATGEIARKHNYDTILNEEAAFFYSPHLDLSMEVVALMDEMYEKAEKENKTVEPKKIKSGAE